MTALPSRPLGRTGMRLSTVGVGAWAMGGPGWETSWGEQDDDESVATIAHAVECGVNWIDTAPIYGLGHSEEVVGRALAAIPAADRPYVFTKCGLWWDSTDRMKPAARDTRRIRRELEHSLARLGVERIDLYQVHWPPFDYPVEDFWPTMVALRDEGKVRAIGLSNFDITQMTAAEAIGHVDSLQPPLSLLRRHAAYAEIPWCTANGTGVIIYSPLESGLLSGGFDASRAASLPASDWRATGPEFTGAALLRNLALVDALRPIADRHEVGVAAVAIGWTLAQPGVSGAIVGARNPAQVDGWLPAAGLALTDADLVEIDAAIVAHHLSAATDLAGIEQTIRNLMRAFLVDSPGRHGLADMPEPKPGPGELLVAPAAVGLCGSDLELLDGRRPAEYVRYPVIPGHEWAGHVVACGPDVVGIEPGTPLVAEGVRACGRCARCAEGHNNLCSSAYAETGFTHPGALADRLVVPAHLAHPLGADRRIATAALIEPAACVATGLLEVGIPPAGSRVAVVGDGPLGLLAVVLLRLTSPRELLLVGSRPQRITQAVRLGATDTARRSEAVEGGYDVVVECTNSAAGAAAALGLARRAGTVILLGISGTRTPTVDPDVISLGNLRVQGIFAASRQAWRWLVDLHGSGLFDPETLITHRFELESVDEALAVLADRDAGAIKVVVEPNGGAG